MEFVQRLKISIFQYWKTCVVLLLPLIILPLPIIIGGKESRAAYAIIIMAVFWMTEALPLAITSLLPLVFFPLMGIMDTGDVCKSYMKETNMMFVGGLIVALSIEYCNLHKRIALRVLLVVGASPRRLMLGFMLTTMFMSMWISNTATTAMMVPIVQAVVQELYKDSEDEVEKDANICFGPDGSSYCTTFSESSIGLDLESSSLETKGRQLHRQSPSVDSVADIGKSHQELTVSGNDRKANEADKMRKCLLLALAYSANIGGTGTIIGSGTNLVLKGVIKELYGSATGLNFATWMAFNVPGMLINTFLAWIWLQYLFLGFKRTTINDTSITVVKKLIRNKYEELGPMTFHEAATLFFFLLCIVLWFFRDPQFITGWAHYFVDVDVDDATAVMTIVILLFIVPSRPDFWRCFTHDRDNDHNAHQPSPALLDWKYIQDNLPWGIVLLLGGGFALSDACKSSGLSKVIGAQLSGLSSLNPFLVMFIICILTATITEVASNTATANILLPILAQMAVNLQLNPLYLMLPATVTCSYAFMLPVATPPNAIVFAAGKMNPVDMMKAGFFMNIICVLVVCVLMTTSGAWIFNFEEFPDWAIGQNSSNVMTP